MVEPDTAYIEPTLREVFGADDEHINRLHNFGGTVSITERRRALDVTPFSTLVEMRDTLRANQHDWVRMLPAALRHYVEANFDDPITMGLANASVVLDTAAGLFRMSSEADADKADSAEDE